MPPVRRVEASAVPSRSDLRSPLTGRRDKMRAGSSLLLRPAMN
jgi:hypothetical protein